MMRALQLLLPALLPSWGFFDYIQPSPRIQYQLLDAQQLPVTAWQEFRPRAQQIFFTTMLGRLLWNAPWNKTLFTMSCAERIANQYNTHSESQLSPFNRTTLYVALTLTATFHLANALLFGLNRFFWIWLAAYPSLLWLQQRLTTGYWEQWYLLKLK